MKSFFLTEMDHALYNDINRACSWEDFPQFAVLNVFVRLIMKDEVVIWRLKISFI